MRSIIFLFGLIWVVAIPVSGQGNTLDSLTAKLKAHPKHDSVRFKILITLSDLMEDSPVGSKAYIDQALDLDNKIGFTSGIAKAYYSLAHYFFNRADYPQAVSNGLLALKNYESTNDQHGMLEAYSVLSGI
jgi:hypothetical protein